MKRNLILSFEIEIYTSFSNGLLEKKGALSAETLSIDT